MENSRTESLRRILRYQLDLEILIRLQEKKLIELELNRGKIIRETIELAIINDHINLTSAEFVFPESVRPERPSPMMHISNLENIAENSTYSVQALTTFQSNSKSASSNHQYEVRPDGTVVKLRCPVCFADKFKSPLGFLNHCRINCKTLFTSPEDRQLRAGVPVDISQVPPDVFVTKHPSLVKQEQDLALIRSEIQVSQTDNSRLPTIREHAEAFASILIAEDDKCIITQESIRNEHGVQELTFDDESTNGNSGRFYIQKDIIIGNDATCMLSSSSLTPEMKGKVPTHKWGIYVRPGDYYTKKSKVGADILDDDMSRWLKAVRFHLHPSYRPCVVEVFGPSFRLELDAWGEFPVRVELVFWDEVRNKSLQFVHRMRIFMATRTNRVTPGPERLYTIDIDRETDYSLFKPVFPIPGKPTVTLEQDETNAESKGEYHKDDYELLKEIYKPGSTVGEPSAAELRSYIRLANPSFSLTTEEIRLWLQGEQKSHRQLLQDISSMLYCRYCGSPHQPQDRFETIQKNCSNKPRKIRYVTRSSSGTLLEKAGLINVSKEPISFEFPDAKWLEINSDRNLHTFEEDLSQYPQVELISLVTNTNSMSLESMATLSGAAVAFLKRILSLSLANLDSKEKPEAEFDSNCLTAWHVYGTLVDQSNDFSFLTNAHLSS